MEQDDVYLIDLWRVLEREWKWFVVPLILIVALTFTYLQGVKRQWEATAWIQIGQVDTAPMGQDPKVEPMMRVIDRIQMIPFQNEVVRSIGLSPDSPEAQLYRKSLKLEPLTYEGPLVKLRVLATSPELARQLASATVTQLQTVHQKLESVSLTLAQERLQEVDAELQSATAARDAVQATILRSGSGVVDKDTQASALAGVLLATRNQEIHDLQMARGELVNRLSPAYTYETALMWPVYVPRSPVFPNPVMILGGGILAALFLGTLVAIGRNALRRKN
ncbi:lipopolysaccharide biosynthesis protein [Dyella dinghuensis]|uniref:Lipopolysaccharide biosynthesis protein n=1 Tax=Dyella dinghuensis TaxID=1920169 RepID=A0A432LSA5_9GAMM|nr:Wzz/FepE/Etk N-terminal domain-containing protein [Dyella dinghuensis]RUL63455.1 lipopolysaccharide biosynthesis protein [Dyella dinghuensis]